jgi:hypothetical protein
VQHRLDLHQRPEVDGVLPDEVAAPLVPLGGVGRDGGGAEHGVDLLAGGDVRLVAHVVDDPVRLAQLAQGELGDGSSS